MKKTFKVASIQMDCECGNVKANLKKARTLLVQAKENGAELAVLPELFNVGYNLDMLKDMDYNFSETSEEISEISKELSICIVAGVFEKFNEKYYNSVFVYNNHGEIMEKYRKINLFSLSHEKELFHPGNEIKIFEINNIKFGILICYDIRFPELSRKYFKEGCSALVISSAFPFPRLEHWNILLKARAIENQAYVIASNRIGKDGDMQFAGNSCIIDPWGNVSGILDGSNENFLVQDIDLNELARVRELIPCGKDSIWLDSVLR